MATGVPIVGGALNRADAATNATLAPVMNGWFSPEDQLQGETWAERYANSLKQQERKDAGFAAEHPVVNAGANITGAVAGTIPAVMAAPAAFGVSVAPIAGRMLAGALTGAGIGGVDAAVRYPGDVGAVVKGTGFGLAGGAAGPVLGKGVGYLGDIFTKTPKLLGSVKISDSVPSESIPLDTRAVLQSVADQVVSDLAITPYLAKAVMSNGSYEHLVKGTNLAPASYGKAVERLVARYIRKDSTLSNLFSYQSRPFVSTPNFFGYEGQNIHLLDITTEASKANHLARPYGSHTEYVIHPGLPPNLVFPP